MIFYDIIYNATSVTKEDGMFGNAGPIGWDEPVGCRKYRKDGDPGGYGLFGEPLRQGAIEHRRSDDKK